MFKSIILLVLFGAACVYGGYVLGTKAPTVGDCVNSFLGSK